MRFVCLLLGSTLILCACAATANQPAPPQNYQGPMASEPVIRTGDYWIYERGDSTRTKSTGMFTNLSFPLWVGKAWRYDTAARRPNQPPNTPAEIPAWVDLRRCAERCLSARRQLQGISMRVPMLDRRRRKTLPGRMRHMDRLVRARCEKYRQDEERQANQLVRTVGIQSLRQGESSSDDSG